MRLKPAKLLAVGLALLPAIHAQAENWPAWRGPRGDGSSLDPNPPLHWSSTSNVLWKTSLPGEGHSSPIVWGDRVFLTTALKDTRERLLLALDRNTGQTLWRQTVITAPLEAKNPENSYASATPATDGHLLYTTFLDASNVVVAAHDFSGKQAWLARPGHFYSQWGFSHDPILFDDKVIVDCDSKGENFIAALSRADGKLLWKIPRQNPTQSYSKPLIQTIAGRPQLVVPGNKAVTSYDPATGRQLWVVDGPSDDCVITPVYNPRANLLLSASSWPKRVLLAIKPDGDGNVTRSKVAWSTAEGAPYVPSPAAFGDWFFTSGFATKEAFCFDAATGKILWREKMGLHHASPVTANGLVYFLNDDGVTHVVKAGPAFQLVARNDLGEKTYASPAFSDGQILLRTFTTLYCIAQKPAPNHD